MDKKKTCNCAQQCPCYPHCDQMMDSGQIPGAIPQSWLRGRQQPMEPGADMPDMREMRPMPQPPYFPYPEKQGMRPRPFERDTMTLEEENEQDWQKLKERYPEMARIILAEVEQLCDSMEYEGSVMFDTIPDKVRIRRMTESIYEKVKDRCPVEETADRDEMLVMNQESRRRYPPGQNWLSDLIQVLLYQEMFQRRCRHRGCRHW